MNAAIIENMTNSLNQSLVDFDELTGNTVLDKNFTDEPSIRL